MRYAFIYGGIAGTIIVVLSGLALASGVLGHDSSPVVGYLIMLVGLSLIFAAVKRYRDVELGGVIGFGRAFAIGLGIAAVASLMYVLAWEIYLATPGGSGFIDEFTANVLENMRRQGAPAATIAAKAREMEELATMYRNPLFRIPITLVEIFPVGLIVALISAALLRNPRVLPAVRR